jgi:hypothetical protein
MISQRANYFYSQHNVNGLADINSDSTIKLYPNPVKDEVTVQLSVPPTALAELYTINGQFTNSLKLVEGNNSFNVNSLEPDTYILRIPTANGMINAKLIKQ